MLVVSEVCSRHGIPIGAGQIGGNDPLASWRGGSSGALQTTSCNNTRV